jgi:hypothetical protein
MPSSRLTEDGRCIITTPASWCDVGHELRVAWSAHSFEVSPADWLLRLVQPHPRPASPPGAPDERHAEALLLEALRDGTVHPGLVEGAGGRGFCREGHALHVDAGGQSRCRTCDAERKRRERAELAAETGDPAEPLAA